MDYKQAIVMRTDLGMKKGKIAAQAAHAAVASADKSPDKGKWFAEGQKKVVLKVESEGQLLQVLQDARMEGLPSALIQDAGHTQIPAGTKTCVGIGPAAEDDIDRVTSRLKLL